MRATLPRPSLGAPVGGVLLLLNAFLGACGELEVVPLGDPAESSEPPRAFGPPPLDGLVVWLSADEGVVEEDRAVSAWRSRAGRGEIFRAGRSRPVLIQEPAAGERGTVVRFSGQERLTSVGALQLSSATIFARFRYEPATSDNDYIYQLGATRPKAAGEVMALSRGIYTAEGQHTQAYHFDGQDAHYGGELPSGQFVVTRQVYHGAGAARNDHHELAIGGVLVTMRSPSRAPYQVDGRMTVGSWGGGQYGFEGDLAELLVYARHLSAEEILDVEGYLGVP